MPCRPTTRSCSASIEWSCAGVSGPGGSMPWARSTSSCCCWTSPPSFVSSSACSSPGVVRRVARSVADLRRVAADRADLAVVRVVGRPACRSRRSPGPRPRRARRAGSRRRPGRRGAGAERLRAGLGAAAAVGHARCLLRRRRLPRRACAARSRHATARGSPGSRLRRSRSRGCHRRSTPMQQQSWSCQASVREISAVQDLSLPRRTGHDRCPLRLTRFPTASSFSIVTDP